MKRKRWIIWSINGLRCVTGTRYLAMFLSSTSFLAVINQSGVVQYGVVERYHETFPPDGRWQSPAARLTNNWWWSLASPHTPKLLLTHNTRESWLSYSNESERATYFHKFVTGHLMEYRCKDKVIGKINIFQLPKCFINPWLKGNFFGNYQLSILFLITCIQTPQGTYCWWFQFPNSFFFVISLKLLMLPKTSWKFSGQSLMKIFAS